RCDVVAGGTIELDPCRTEAIRETRAKGGGFLHPYRIAIAGVTGPEIHDGYTQNLTAFGYNEQFLQLSAGVEVTALRRVTRRLYVGVLAGVVKMPDWMHDIAGSTAQQKLQWTPYAIDAAL